MLLSQSDNLDTKEAKEIADAAMLEVASLTVVHMVRINLCSQEAGQLNVSQQPQDLPFI